MKIVHVILSGGVGSRLRPISRKSIPKLYIPMFGDDSPLSNTLGMQPKLPEPTEITETYPGNAIPPIAYLTITTHTDDILPLPVAVFSITNETISCDATSVATPNVFVNTRFVFQKGFRNNNNAASISLAPGQ